MRHLTACLLMMILPLGNSLRAQEWPTDGWATASPAEAEMLEAGLIAARDYAVAHGDGAGYIVRHGKLVMSWGDDHRLFDLKSTTKSIGATALGVAIGDSLLDLSVAAEQRHPSFGIPPESNDPNGWLAQITIANLATHTAGFEKTGGYGDLILAPESGWLYSDGATNWLAEILTLAFNEDLRTVLMERVLQPLGLDEGDFAWRNNIYRPDQIEGIVSREIGSGISANVDFMARIGYLYLRNGTWEGTQILPVGFSEQVRTPVPEFQNLLSADPIFADGAREYGLLWWSNATGAMSGVPLDTYTSWGLGESFIVVIPSLDIVVSRAGKGWRDNVEEEHFFPVLEPFLQSIVNSVNDTSMTAVSPSVAQPLGQIALAPNRPNPFNGRTTITFANSRAQELCLEVFDLRGRKIETLLDRWVEAGEFDIPFSSGRLPSGSYLYRLKSRGASQTGVMHLVK